MQTRPPFDRTLLIPVAIGVVSILGIGWILSTTSLGKALIRPTAIPSSFSSIERATLTSSPLVPPTQDETPPTASVTSPVAYPGPLVETLSATSTIVTESLPTPSATYTPIEIRLLPAGRHDDMDPNISYDPYWTALKNPGTANAYKGTLHASNGIGNQASFRFTGKRFYLGYQRGKNFGTVTVLIDNEPYSFNEQAFDLVWRSPDLLPGDHFVRIIHESGESINLDYIDIVN